MSDLIHKTYTDPRSPGSYGGVERLYREVKKINKKIKRSQVTDWARQQNSYTLHKPARRNITRNKVIVFAVDEVWQMDLCDMQNIKQYNDDAKYILTVIDVFSKKGFARVLTDKRGETVLKAFKNIIETEGRSPVRVHADAGSEFRYGKFNQYLKSIESKYYVTQSSVKASIVERFNRTLKSRMWRYFTEKNTYRYLDVLQDLIASYNASPHSTLKGRTPDSVGPHNELEVWKQVYHVRGHGKIKFKYRVNDRVRISREKTLFEKGYTDNWSEEYFIVYQRLRRHPPVYRLKDLSGEKLEGSFYEQELQRVDVPEDRVYAIEKVIRKNRGKALVKWRGWPEKFNSWVPLSDIKNV